MILRVDDLEEINNKTTWFPNVPPNFSKNQSLPLGVANTLLRGIWKPRVHAKKYTE